MTMSRASIALFAVVLGAALPAAAAPAAPAPAAAAPRSPALKALSARYVDGLFKAKPHLGSYMGDHRFDGKLVDVSPAARKARLAELKKQAAELAKLKPGLKAMDDVIDADIMASGIALEQLYLTEIREFEWEPRLHDSFAVYDPQEVLAERLADFMHGDYAPVAVRTRAVVAMLQAVPKLVAQYRANLKNPPKVYAEQAIKENKGQVELLKTEVAAFLKANAGKEQARTDKALAAAIKALEGYGTFLRQDLLPRSTGDWRLGAERYRKKFPLALLTTLTPEETVARAEAALKRTRTELYALALKLHQQMFPKAKLPGPKPTPAEQAAVINRVRDEIAKDHPTAEGVLQSNAGGLDRMRAFIEKHDLVKLPPKESLVVVKTPAYKSGVAQAEYLPSNMLDEKVPFKGTYYVDPPDPNLPKDKVEALLRTFNTTANELTAIHEAYPGHHLQAWYAKQIPNRLRVALQNMPMAEGWAVYGEDLMVLRNGWGGAKNDRYRFLTLAGHLIVAGNAILDIKVHTGQWGEAEAIKFMVDGWMKEKAYAESKLHRAQLDSTQLTQYFLGWDEILELERDYKAKVGKAFSQRAFDEALVGHGTIAVKYLRQYLMGK
jgi:uncharacterized protein (DUF885 family)